MLLLFLATIAFAAFADNINPPSGLQAIDPAKVAKTPPFDHPGVRRLADGSYEAYYVAEVFAFNPASITVPVGKKVTFYVTSVDVVHGFFIAKTDVNMMAVPGWHRHWEQRSPQLREKQSHEVVLLSPHWPIFQLQQWTNV